MPYNTSIALYFRNKGSQLYLSLINITCPNSTTIHFQLKSRFVADHMDFGIADCNSKENTAVADNRGFGTDFHTKYFDCFHKARTDFVVADSSDNNNPANIYKFV
jgi:hypothetical protein